MSREQDPSDEYLVTGGVFRGRILGDLDGELDGDRLPDRIGRYRVLGLLGEGGMGRVVEAVDPELGRRVAIKFLPPTRSDDEDARARLRREAQAISALSHPNICVLYEVGTQIDEDSGRAQPFLVFERAEGRTLRELTRDTMPTTSQALDIVIALADALDTAHRSGVLHRDIKPPNIVVAADGRVKLLDFGIAKFLSRPGAANDRTPTLPDAGLTETGHMLGTIAYMAPEQIRGEPVDERTDLFALGAVLYELLAGRKAFPGATPGASLEAVLRRDPPSLEAFGHPPRLQKLVQRALAKDPGDRFESAAEMRDALRQYAEAEAALRASPRHRRDRRLRLGVAIVVTLLAVLGLASLGSMLLDAARPQRDPAPAPPSSVAVLRFDDLSARNATLEVLVPDEILAVLARTEGLAVRPFSASLQVDAESGSPATVGELLGADVLVGGHIVARGDVLQLSVEAVNAAGEDILWRGFLEVDPTDLLGMRHEVTRMVRADLLPALGVGAVSAPPQPDSEEAYRLYVDALPTLSDPEPGRRAIEQLRRAVVLDPGFARAWLELGRRLRIQSFYWADSEEENREAIEATRRAVELDPLLFEGRTALVGFQLEDGSIDEAFEVARALALERPRTAAALIPLALVRRYQGRLEESVAICERARELDPRAPEVRQCLLTYLFSGERSALGRSTLAVTSLLWQNELSARLALLDDDPVEAATLWQRQVDPTAGLLRRDHLVSCLLGRSDEAADRFAAEFETLSNFRDGEWVFYSAGYFARCGHPEEALVLLRHALERGYCVTPSPDVDPLLTPLAGTPELTRLGDAARTCQERVPPLPETLES